MAGPEGGGASSSNEGVIRLRRSMSVRFRRSLRLLPGVRLNIGTRSMSVTVGRPGATVNFSNRGTYGNVGVPGTGISIRERLDAPGPPGRRAFRPRIIGIGVVLAAITWALLRAF